MHKRPGSSAARAGRRRSAESWRWKPSGDLYHCDLVAYVTLDRAGKILEVNTTAARLLGVERSHLVEQPFGAYVTPADQSVFGSFLPKVFGSPTPEACEVRLRVEGRSPRQVRIEAVVGRSGRACCVVVTDLSNRQRMEEELWAAHQRLRFQLAETPAVLYAETLDSPSRLIFVSENVRTLLGYEPEELTGNPGFWQRQVHPHDVARTEACYAAVLREGFSVFEYRLRDKQGNYHWLRDHVRLVRDARGQPAELVGCAIEITDRVEAEQALHRAREQVELRVQARTEELEQSLAALRASEERLRMALEVARMATWDWDLAAGTIRYSQNAEAMVGGATHEVYGTVRSLLEQVHPEDRPALERAIERTRTEFARFECEYRVRRLNGTYFWVHAQGEVVVPGEGQPTCVRGVSMDISRRRQAEEARRAAYDELEQRVRERTAELEAANILLRLRESEVRTLVEHSHDLIVRLDLEGLFSYVNLAMVGLLDVPAQEVLGKRLRELGQPEALWEPARKAFERVVAQRRAIVEELAHEFGGRRRHFEAHFMPEFAFDGSICSVLVVGREVTERKQAEEALRKAELRSRALADGAFEGLFIHHQGVIREANPAAVGLFGCPAVKMIGKPLQEFPDSEADSWGWGSSLTEEPQHYETLGRRQDGQTFPVEIRSRRLTLDGHSISVVAVHDLTKHKQDQDQIRKLENEEALKREQAARESYTRQLIEAQELERRRIATEIHDGLGQNLLAIKHQAERGLVCLSERWRVRQHLTVVAEIAAQSVRDIRNIVQRLHPYLLERLGLSRALRAMAEFIGKSSSVTIHSHIEELDRRLPLESETALYRVLQECLNNVVKHAQATEARVCLRQEADRLCAIVEDDGCGFDPVGVMRSTGLTGFGLRGIIERIALRGGTARILSQPAGGTRIEIELPIEPAGPAPAARRLESSGGDATVRPQGNADENDPDR